MKLKYNSQLFTHNVQESEHFVDEPADLSEIMDFSAYDLPTTIRLIALSGESRCINITRGSLSGKIYIKAGEIFRAETAQMSGDEAFFAILSWNNESHCDSQYQNIDENNISVPTSVLLDLIKPGN